MNLQFIIGFYIAISTCLKLFANHFKKIFIIVNYRKKVKKYNKQALILLVHNSEISSTSSSYKVYHHKPEWKKIFNLTFF